MIDRIFDLCCKTVSSRVELAVGRAAVEMYLSFVAALVCQLMVSEFENSLTKSMKFVSFWYSESPIEFDWLLPLTYHRNQGRSARIGRDR